jgi:ubiquinone/menaquinone biosynthesis C-methylase UbiE
MSTKMIGKDYYDYGKSRGVDMNFYGNWQKNYAQLIVHCADIPSIVSNKSKSTFLDFGTGCGVDVRAIKELKIFTKCYGLDINSYLLDLGRKTHGFSKDELRVHDISINPLPFEDNSITFLHCAQTLEHIDEKYISYILSEFNRVLEKDGVVLITVPVLHKMEDLAKAQLDEITHVTLKMRDWWEDQFKKHLEIDNTGNLRFKNSPISPNGPNSKKSFYHHYNHVWYLCVLKKGKN